MQGKSLELIARGRRAQAQLQTVDRSLYILHYTFLLKKDSLNDNFIRVDCQKSSGSYFRYLI